MRFLCSILCVCCCFLHGQDEIKANPNRPTFANHATTTQDGVLEMEEGVQRTVDVGVTTYSPILLKYGVTPTFEVHVAWNGYQFGDPHGLTDPQLGIAMLVLPQASYGVDLGFTLNHKFPTSPTSTGHSDDSLGLLVSKDFGPWHVDANYFVQTMGKIRQDAKALSLSRTLTDRLQVGAECYSAAPGCLAALWNVAYAVRPSVVVDCGFDRGLTSTTPRWNLFAGVTWAMRKLK